SGFVNSREEKRRAESIIDAVSGVRDIHNRLRLQAQQAAQANAPQTTRSEVSAPTSPAQEKAAAQSQTGARPTHH
ncbi:MAG: BON domain-containing protein, partial [Povalibacter sp.]